MCDDEFEWYSPLDLYYDEWYADGGKGHTMEKACLAKADGQNLESLLVSPFRHIVNENVNSFFRSFCDT